MKASSFSPLQQVQMIAKLADLQEWNEQNRLLLDALIDLLIEKGVISEQELQAKAAQLDSAYLHQAQEKGRALTPIITPPIS
ncbi:hypothetical protein [Brevibacillus fulvus]|uniref:Uncharacterized protein n=1 Tax=Brevibacillus fulvus TaxID=1125967 RepID=A0A938XWI1_9BACL|nr:hypothetical protein [Brevibacillus fulvus]MBM7591788.1 hypothetical protein [Brevibacillus fulvus]